MVISIITLAHFKQNISQMLSFLFMLLILKGDGNGESTIDHSILTLKIISLMQKSVKWLIKTCWPSMGSNQTKTTRQTRKVV